MLGDYYEVQHFFIILICILLTGCTPSPNTFVLNSETSGQDTDTSLHEPQAEAAYANVEIALPGTIYGLVGQELNIYFDNILSDRDTRYDFSVGCNIGAQYDYRFQATSQKGQEGWYRITIQIWNNRHFAASVETILRWPQWMPELESTGVF